MNKDDKRSSDPLAPKLVEEISPMPDMHDMIETEFIKEEEPVIIDFELECREEKPT